MGRIADTQRFGSIEVSHVTQVAGPGSSFPHWYADCESYSPEHTSSAAMGGRSIRTWHVGLAVQLYLHTEFVCLDIDPSERLRSKRVGLEIVASEAEMAPHCPFCSGSRSVYSFPTVAHGKTIPGGIAKTF